MSKRGFVSIILSFLFLAIATTKIQAATYYVDSNIGSDSNSCSAAQNTSTPKRSVSGITSCNPGPGDIVRFRGTFTTTLTPTRSGQVLYPAQNIQQVSGSQVTFINLSPTGLNPQTDWLTIYNSRKGNSGAFPVVSVSGNTVTVDTSDLPFGGQFLTETMADPGNLQAAIVRPVHYTAWDKNNPPVWTGNMRAIVIFDRGVIMLSYLHTTTEGSASWGAVEINGDLPSNMDYIIFDHLEVENAEAGIVTNNGEYHSNYDIVQHNHIHNIGYQGNASEEHIYWGNFLRPDLHHDYVQIMYNRVGPHKDYPVADIGSGVEFIGDGIEIKSSGHFPTIFGNEVQGIHATYGCDDSPIRSAGQGSFISHNYVHDINPRPENIPGCGISIVEGAEGGANDSIVANNILANVKTMGIRVLASNNVQVLNNVVYNIIPQTHCSPGCDPQMMGIAGRAFGSETSNLVIRNNIVHTANTGIGRYPWDSGTFSATIDHNIVYNTTNPFWGISQSPTNIIGDPGLINPSGGNFAISATSLAHDAGTNLSSIFSLDNHDAADPTLPNITSPIIRSGSWDIGAFEYSSGDPTATPTSTPGIPGDANGDGVVDGIDYVIWLNHYNQATQNGHVDGDFNSDQIVDGIDYVIWLNNYSSS